MLNTVLLGLYLADTCFSICSLVIEDTVSLVPITSRPRGCPGHSNSSISESTRCWGRSRLILISSYITPRSRSISFCSKRELRRRSDRTSRAMSKWGLATFDQYMVSSLSVPPFSMPPMPSMSWLISLEVGLRSVPLKNRCSVKWVMPASCSSS